MLGHRGTDHNDLVQSALEQIVMTLRRRRFRHACSLRAWAAAITTRMALATMRSRTREQRAFDRSACASTFEETCPASTDVEREVVTRAQMSQLREHLAAMSPDRAMAVVLHHVLEQDIAQIAATTGVSVAAAQSRLVRGRRELQQRMATGKCSPGREGGSR